MSAAVKNIIKIALTALFLLLCALIPPWLAPASPSVSTPPADVSPPMSPSNYTRAASSFSERVAIYSAYSDGKISPTYFSSGELSKDLLQTCEISLQQIVGSLLVENWDYDNVYTESDGVEFFTLANEDGVYIRVLYFFVDLRGIWKNWIKAYIDVDTQDIYFIYTSCGEIDSGVPKRYAGFDIGDISDFAQNYTGLEILAFDYIGQTGQENERDIFHLTFGNSHITKSYEIHGFTSRNADGYAVLLDYIIICKNLTTSMQNVEEYDAIAP